MQNVNRQQLAKTKHTTGCNKEIIFGKQWRNIELPEEKKKRAYTQKEKIFTERGLEELERLKSNNESKSFYQKLNKNRKDFQPSIILCRDKEGMFLSEKGDILRRYTEHFDELLNIEFSNQNAISQENYQVYLATDEPTPTLDEVENAIQKLMDNKALGMTLYRQN